MKYGKKYYSKHEFINILLNQKQEDKQVVILGDRNVSMQKLLDVLTLLRKHNIPTADIVMDKK